MKKITILCWVLLCAFGVNAQEDKTSEASKTNISGTIGVGTMYHGFDVGGDFFRGAVQKNSLTITRQFTKKLSGCIDFWGQYALTKKHPNGAEEFDVGVCLTYKPRPTTAVDLYAGNFKVNGLSVQKFSVTVSQDTKIGKVPLTVSNSFMGFTTSKPSVLKGGLVNKTNLSSFVALSKKVTLSGEVGLGLDNGPFGLNGPAAMLFLKTGLARKLNKNWSVFGDVRYSRPLAGETIRKPVVSANVGLAFSFDL